MAASSRLPALMAGLSSVGAAVYFGRQYQQHQKDRQGLHPTEMVPDEQKSTGGYFNTSIKSAISFTESKVLGLERMWNGGVHGAATFLINGPAPAAVVPGDQEAVAPREPTKETKGDYPDQLINELPAEEAKGDDQTDVTLAEAKGDGQTDVTPAGGEAKVEGQTDDVASDVTPAAKEAKVDGQVDREDVSSAEEAKRDNQVDKEDGEPMAQNVTTSLKEAVPVDDIPAAEEGSREHEEEASPVGEVKGNTKGADGLQNVKAEEGTGITKEEGEDYKLPRRT